jgi:hypothetical protein
MEHTHWGTVSIVSEPDGGNYIVLMLDGREYTFESHLAPLMAFRIGQDLVRAARNIGLPGGIVDAEV